MIPVEGGNAIGVIGEALLPALPWPCPQTHTSAILGKNGNAIPLTGGCRTSAWRRRYP